MFVWDKDDLLQRYINIIMQQKKLSVCYTVRRNIGRQGVACAPASETRIKKQG